MCCAEMWKNLSKPITNMWSMEFLCVVCGKTKTIIKGIINQTSFSGCGYFDLIAINCYLFSVYSLMGEVSTFLHFSRVYRQSYQMLFNSRIDVK